MDRIAKASVVIALLSMMSACVVATHDHEGYREGYYDSEHHRYYHEHNWHDCGEHDDHCR